MDLQLDDNVLGLLKLPSTKNFWRKKFLQASFDCENSCYTVVWLQCQDSYQTSCLSMVKWSRSC